MTLLIVSWKLKLNKYVIIISNKQSDAYALKYFKPNLKLKH